MIILFYGVAYCGWHIVLFPIFSLLLQFLLWLLSKVQLLDQFEPSVSLSITIWNTPTNPAATYCCIYDCTSISHHCVILLVHMSTIWNTPTPQFILLLAAAVAPLITITLPVHNSGCHNRKLRLGLVTKNFGLKAHIQTFLRQKCCILIFCDKNDVVRIFAKKELFIFFAADTTLIEADLTPSEAKLTLSKTSLTHTEVGLMHSPLR